MRNAYALLGLSFLLVFGGAYVLLTKEAKAPATSGESLVTNQEHAMTLTSPAFGDGGAIPATYTCDGENISPPLQIEGVPEGTESLVLVMDDPDIPEEVKEKMNIDTFDHWAVYDLPADTREIPEGATLGTPAKNSKGETGYTGPCPPADLEPYVHRYIFRVYAVSETLDFTETPTLSSLESEAERLSLGTATLTGVYGRHGQ